MKSNHINFYFLSSGFCGTRFHYHALRLATNAEVWHQPGHEEIGELTNLMEQQYDQDHNSILLSDFKDYLTIKRRIDKRLQLR